MRRGSGELKWLIGAGVVLAACAAFVPSLSNGFVNWDDFQNITSNIHFRGLGPRQLGWMFTTTHTGHYYPLYWLSFAVDHAVWGLDPFGFHLTSLILHAIVSALAFLAAFRILKLLYPKEPEEGLFGLAAAAGVAAVFFAIHPLRVESVAWATQRKDPLCGVFYLASILAYLRAHKAGGGRWLALSFGAFVLACLSKPNAITLPAVLLILDWHPLRRVPSGRGRRRAVLWLLVEKIPYALMACFTAGMTYVTHVRNEAVGGITEGLLDRAAHSAYGLIFYPWKTLFPVGLTPLYEFPSDFDPLTWPYPAAAAAALGVTAVLIRGRRTRPGLLALWLAYAVTIAPNLGIMKVGTYLAADRYSYFSCMGWILLIGTAWLGARGLGPRWRRLVPAGAALAAAVLICLTWSYAARWRDSETLWEHALRLEPRHSTALTHLGHLMLDRGKPDRAVERFREAVDVDPQAFTAYIMLGETHRRLGRPEEAIGFLQRAIEIRPGLSQAHYSLGDCLLMLGKVPEAREQYRLALRRTGHIGVTSLIPPGGAPDRGIGLLIKRLRRRVRREPQSAAARMELANALARRGDFDAAAETFRETLELDPRGVRARMNLAGILTSRGRLDEAAVLLRESLRLRPWNAAAHHSLANVLVLQGEPAQAMSHYRKALLVDPRHLGARRALEITRLRMDRTRRGPAAP